MVQEGTGYHHTDRRHHSLEFGFRLERTSEPLGRSTPVEMQNIDPSVLARDGLQCHILSIAGTDVVTLTPSHHIATSHGDC